MHRLKTILSLALFMLIPTTVWAQFPLQTIGSILPRSAADTLTSQGDCSVPVTTFGFPGFGFQITGSFDATVQFEVSSDGSNYRPLNVVASNSSTPSTTTTVVGMYTGSFTGASHIRACATVYASGTVTVVASATLGGGSGGAGGGGGSVTQFPEDGGHTTGDSGVQFLAVRNDAGTVLAGTTLDYIPLTTDATGALRVAVTAAAGGTSSTFGAAVPSQGTAVGFSDGTNMVSARAFDTDTSGGVFTTLLTNLVFRTAGTPVEAGIAANPFNVVFPSAQAVTQSGTWNVGTLTTVTNPVAVTQSGTWTNNVGTFPDNEPFNLAQCAGVTCLTGNGASGTGALRVTVANDSTGTIIASQATAANLNAQVVGTVAVDGAVSGNPVPSSYRASTAVPTAVSADNDVQLGWVTRIGLFNSALRDLAGDSAMDETNNALRVNVVTGAGGGANIVDDAPFTVAVTSLTPVGGIFRTALDTVDDNDSGAFAMTQRRALHMSLRRESDGAEWGVAATAPVAVRFSDGSSFLNLASDCTHDSAVCASGPVKMLEAVSDLSANTPVADGDAVRAVGDLNGRAIQIIGCDRSAAVGGVTTITDGSSTAATGFAAQGASIFNEVRNVTIVNTSTTPVTVDMRDGTAGSVLYTFPVPASTDNTHGGVTMNFTVPRYGTANTPIAFDPSAAATSIIISATGCKVK